MIQPARLTESQALAAHLQDQVEAARTAAFGLSEAEARLCPARSVLSIGGILKHLSITWTAWQLRAASERGERGWEPTEEDGARFYGSFALTDDETLEGVLEEYDAATAALLAEVEAMDPDAEVLQAPAPWFGRLHPAPVTARMLALHMIVEFARHAGHADIIREQLDGAQAGPLMMAVHDIAGNDFVQPWRPEPANA